VFTHPDFDGHEHIAFCYDHASGLRAIIAIHSLALGPALGGCRLRSYGTLNAAITDALRLSRAMSFKNALGDRPFGGGKAVILANSTADKSDAMLEGFGHAVNRLGGDYITAEDAGIDPGDVARIARTTRHVRNIAEEQGGPAPYTAYGMFVAIKAALSEALGKDLEGATVCVQGLGGVGMDLCRRLSDAGARVIVSDIVQDRCESATEQFGCRQVATEAAHKVEADVFSPCAFGGVLSESTIDEIRAPIVAGAANNQLATADDGKRLAARGIIYCPDYVINAGGIRATAAPGEAFDHEAALRRVEGIDPLLRRIVAEARASGRPTSDIADDLARTRIGGFRPSERPFRMLK
jgi:leucine dehydrogenase